MVDIEAQKRQNSRYAHLPECSKIPQEKFQLVSRDLIRSLYVPRKVPCKNVLVIDNNEYNRLKNASHFINKEEKLLLAEEQQKIRQILQQESQNRRKKMEQMNAKQMFEEEEVKDSEEDVSSMMKKLKEIKCEEDDEMRTFNHLVNQAKVYAVRDAQVREKNEIAKIKMAEEQRICSIMEKNRKEGLRRQLVIDKGKLEQNKVFRGLLLNQIQEREEEKILEREQKNYDGKMMLQKMMDMQQEDLEEYLKKKEKQLKLQEELKKENDDLTRYREQAKERDKQLTQQIMQYMKQKAEREEAFESEQLRIKREKENEVARLRKYQQRIQDKQAERDALRLRRNQEKADREWRERELEKERKRIQMNQQLNKERQQQIDHQIGLYTIELQREKNEFERILRLQMEQMANDTALREHRYLTGRKYGKELWDQVKQKEMELKAERKAIFEETLSAEMEKQKLMKELKSKKITDLRKAKVPETYVAALERLM